MKRSPIWPALYVTLQWTWGILQNLCGLAVFTVLVLRRPCLRPRLYHGAIVTPWAPRRGSMGLGMFIFFGHGERPEAELVMVHEWGHTIQSLILGPLYLFVIGLPSLIWATSPRFVKHRRLRRTAYTAAYCEKWASRTGEKLLGRPAYWG